MMGDIKIGRMVLGVCQTNCYFLYRDGEHEAIVVDPADQGGNIYAALQKNGFRVAGILLTHGHFDHIWGLDALRDAANAAAEADGKEPVKAYACEAERELLKSPRLNVSEQAGRACATYADVYVKEAAAIILRKRAFWSAEIRCLPSPWVGRTSLRAAWGRWCAPSRRSCSCCRRIHGCMPGMGRAPLSVMRRKTIRSAYSKGRIGFWAAKAAGAGRWL